MVLACLFSGFGVHERRNLSEYLHFTGISHCVTTCGKLSVLCRPELLFFSVLRFPAFFQAVKSMAAEGPGALNEQLASTETSQSTTKTGASTETDQSTTKTMLSVLNSIQDSMNSSNTLLREFLEQKRKSRSSSQAESTAKRKKLAHHINESASEKAKATTSEEVYDRNASDEAHDSTSDENEDALSLFGNGSLIDEQSEPEGELNNDELLTQITTSLSSSDETGPPVSEKLSKLVNDKFQVEYSVEKRKEILQKYKIPVNCTELSVPRVNPEI